LIFNLVKRRGKLKALVAVARSILVIIWNLLAEEPLYWLYATKLGRRVRIRDV